MLLKECLEREEGGREEEGEGEREWLAVEINLESGVCVDEEREMMGWGGREGEREILCPSRRFVEALCD